MIPIQIKQEGELLSYLVEKNKNLLQELKRLNIQINDGCDGKLTCGACHVQINSQKSQLNITDDEKDMLQFVPGVKGNSRLACGVLVEDSLTDSIITVVKQE
ncbi:2Fe-2S_ferredoxin 1 [Hexamita inflata]|uniref:2Fe-2S ferredoxin 1 n=1 Tax=Hexamita inflata TaxID=28002 RepID=A0AA86UMU1_9EUKA|nr:2Fe-2S ferredoxin 1 [Hexamita inflata]CAI9957660.1 2Fe-2S ferredoxin 1 [Hexamita inflata]CAI9963713.1 2Fe-2S ferredoxin 1 [Hexamita inflata]CAI9964555.1 2Fe-2S ferredoxin 1 [Hexamita inflata]